MSKPAMKVARVAIASLRPDPANARRHSHRNIDAIMSSLVRFGQQKPIVVDGRNVVRAGNGTLTAAKALGWTHLDVVRSDLPANELAAYAVVDNRAAELAEWDNELLMAVLDQDQPEELGFSAAEFESLGRAGAKAGGEEAAIGERYEVVVECADERNQRQLYERLCGEGWTCRLLTL